MKVFNNSYPECVDRYLKEISTTRPVNSADEAELSRQIKLGDRKALDKLIKANLRFVVSVAGNYQNQGVSFEDLIAVGNRGLLKAAKRFDGSKNFKFISYAVWWIRQSILYELSEQSRTIRVPLSRVHKISEFSKAYQTMLKKKQGGVSTNELAEELDVDSQELVALFGLSARAVALDGPINNGESTLIDFFPAQEEEDNLLDEVARKKCVEKLLNLLPSDKHRFVISRFFGLDGHHPHTLEEIAKNIKPRPLTRERVRQLRDSSIDIIKSNAAKSTIQEML